MKRGEPRYPELEAFDFCEREVANTVSSFWVTTDLSQERLDFPVPLLEEARVMDGHLPVDLFAHIMVSNSRDQYNRHGSSLNQKPYFKAKAKNKD